MGAEQSVPGADRQPLGTAVQKTCYYELLGVDRQVADDEIRRAYKKKALELHPDRNLNDTENATRKFAEVQTAYEILSDPQERAWYDSHRDAILSGDADLSGGASSYQPSGGDTPASAIFSLMSRFNSSVQMTDSPSGFFGILNAFFDQLAAEETAAAEWDGAVVVEYPPFGRAKDDYDSVAKPFYLVWSSFSTKKSFSWMDKYRLGDAPDRRVRRLMEKENKKFREDGIREFNDAVQSLVAFVKKRDPRYVPNTQSEAERQQVLRTSAAAQAARSRAAHQEKLAGYTVPAWAQSRNDGDHSDEFSVSEEESEVEHIECVVCNKIFKSEKQFEAHEKSKKHVKAVQLLRRQMKRENADFDLQDRTSSTVVPPRGNEDEKPTGPAGLAGSVPSSSAEAPEDDKGGPKPNTTDEHVEKPNISSPDATEDDEYAPRSAVESRVLPENSRETEADRDDVAASIDSAAASVNDLNLNGTSSGKKVGKAKLKREKRAARQATDGSTHESYKCAVCNEAFESRTKLFSHINELGHAAPVPKARASRKQKR